MKTFFGYPCLGIAVVVLVAVSVIFSGCTSPTSKQIAPQTSSPGVTASQGAPVPVSTMVSASLPYGVTLVDGCPPTPLGRVEAHIGRDPKNRKKMAVTDPASGREAITEYRTLESFKRHTYLEIHPLTGRTHQIRVHMKFLGCPVTGDTVYGYKNPTIILHRHFLHAARLKIRLPGEDAPRVFFTPLPVELQRTLDELR